MRTASNPGRSVFERAAAEAADRGSDGVVKYKLFSVTYLYTH